MPTIDPTFYRSPGHAVAAAPEQLAYVAAFDPTSQQKDALAVVDCDPESTTFGGVVGWTELPTSVTNSTISAGTRAQRALPRGTWPA